MNLPFPDMVPDWKWGTSEGSREFDRRLDRTMTFAEIVSWLEEAEDLTITMRQGRQPPHPGSPDPAQR